MPSQSVLLLPLPVDLRNLPVWRFYRMSSLTANNTVSWVDVLETFCQMLYDVLAVQDEYPVLRQCLMDAVSDDYIRAHPSEYTVDTVVRSGTVLLDSLYHGLVAWDGYRDGLLAYDYLWFDLPDTAGFATTPLTDRDAVLDLLESDREPLYRFFSNPRRHSTVPRVPHHRLVSNRSTF